MDHCTERLDPRIARSRVRAISATLELVSEAGAMAVTMEAVAARSGVAKTTLYRQFSDREDLLFAAFESLTDGAEVEAGTDVVADVERWLLRFADAFVHADFAPLVPSLVEAAERSSRGQELAVAFATRRRRPLVTYLERAQAAGALSYAVNADDLVSRLVGPLFYLRYIARRPITAEFVGGHVRATLGPLVP